MNQYPSAKQRPNLVWRLAAALVLLPAAACDIGPFPVPALADPPPGLGGSGSVIAFLRPDVTLLHVGESTTFTYTTQPEVQTLEVVWINEHPAVVSVETPVPDCGTRCARVTALAAGTAQLRPYAIINGGRIEAPWRIAVIP